MALKAIVEQDYDDYLRSTFQGGINQSVLHNSSEEETTKKQLKKSIKARATTEFDIAIDPKKEPLLGPKHSDEETTERQDAKRSSSGEIEFDVNEEFSKSIQDLMTPGLKQVLTTVH